MSSSGEIAATRFGGGADGPAMQAWTAAHHAEMRGDFNQSNTDDHVMSPTDDGRLAITLLLPPGRYEFRYRLDNEVWVNDPGADDYALKEHGGYNSVVDATTAVPASTASPAGPGRAAIA